mmetsp:Transcript_21408/g.64255  ORF Transcript_21408/g.64255 Transcript_21408/m.64255 type:complete len:216 (+) Transcript_21408:737-1384(+)
MRSSVKQALIGKALAAWSVAVACGPARSPSRPVSSSPASPKSEPSPTLQMIRALWAIDVLLMGNFAANSRASLSALRAARAASFSCLFCASRSATSRASSSSFACASASARAAASAASRRLWALASRFWPISASAWSNPSSMQARRSAAFWISLFTFSDVAAACVKAAPVFGRASAASSSATGCNTSALSTAGSGLERPRLKLPVVRANSSRIWS